MIVIEIMNDDIISHKFFAYQAISRAINHIGEQLVLWDSRIKNIYDVYDEINPKMILFHSRELINKLNKLNIKNWDFNNWYINKPMIHDPILYKKLEPVENIKCDYLCISPYPDIEDNFNIDKYIDKNFKHFRYFGYTRIGGHKDCGMIPENAFSMFLSSAKNVVCKSGHFAINAYACNKNILNFEVCNTDLFKFSSLNIVKSIL